MLEVVYLIFNEGYAATAGEDLMRPALCAEAQRLGRILAGLLPDEPEVFGLLALMEIQASRLAARTGPDGALLRLTEQNRARWDQLLIRRGLAALARAEALGGADGPYALQAALAACHARARTAADTDWRRIAALYDRLRDVMPSPVVDLNRAVAHSMAFGPDAGLALIAELDQAAALRGYAPLPAARGDFLFRAGRLAEARSSSSAPRRSPATPARRIFCLAARRSAASDTTCRFERIVTLPYPPLDGEGRRRAIARRRGGVSLPAKRFTPPRSLRSRPSPSRGGWTPTLRPHLEPESQATSA